MDDMQSRIRTKKELKFFNMADRIMNGYSPVPTSKELMLSFVAPNYILDYLKSTRHYCYHVGKNHRVRAAFWKLRRRRLGVKLGFSIGANAFGYGLVIPHYGTIVVGNSVKAGNYCVLNTCVVIGGGGGKEIGDGLYMGAGAKMMKNIKLGNYVSVGANSLVNCSFPEGSCLVVGSPAKKMKPTIAWWDRDGVLYQERHDRVERLKRRMNIPD